jgi:hypothetical protein
MPYIKKEDRTRFESVFRKLHEVGKINNPGELNYIFTMIINHYLIGNGMNYQRINDAIGALEGAKLELYRTTVSEYEDKKIKENGGV